MKNAEVSRQWQKLDAAIKKAFSSTTQLELQAHWARYFCVLASGFIENALKELYTEFVKRTCHNQVSSYAGSQLSHLKNPNAERFLQVARAFDARWASDIDAFMGSFGGKDAIDAIMNHRHLIAHGKDTTITIVRLRDYLNKALDVLERIEVHTNP